MKLLCLHGSFGSAKNFEVQLGPLLMAMKSNPEIEFKFISGQHPAPPPPGYEDNFGEGPLYRHIPFDGLGAYSEWADKMAHMTPGETPESTMRQMAETKGTVWTRQGVKDAVYHQLKAIDEDPEIDGILGYSEGAIIASSVILEERRRWEEEGIPRRLKCGVFFAGWPPLSIKGNHVSMVLGDECDDMGIDIPTCHVVGCSDPYIDGAMALFNMCDEETAEFFDHGKGHTLPSGTRTLEELRDALLRLADRAETASKQDLFLTSSSNISVDSLVSPTTRGRSDSTAATSVESFTKDEEEERKHKGKEEQ